MDSTAPGPTKAQLRALAAQAATDQQTFIAHLSAAERDAIGAPDAWAAKDHLAHCAAWQGQAARLLAAAAQGSTPDPAPDETEYNPAVFAAQRERPWADVAADATAAHAALVAALEACDEATLTTPVGLPWRAGRPLWTLLLGNGYEHPVEHYAQYYSDHGDPAHALALKQKSVAEMGALFGETEPYGNALYNLGCFYALIGQPAPALAALDRALVLCPHLREWAGQDPDFVSLHADPAFQALVSG